MDLKYVPSFSKHMNVDGIHDYLKEIKENTFDKYDIMPVGEANSKFNMLFQFEHIDLWNNDGGSAFSVPNLKKVWNRWQTSLDTNGWNALFIENHDVTRIVSSWGNDKIYGKYNLILSDDEQIFAYERLLRDDKFLVICNISDENVIYYYD